MTGLSSSMGHGAYSTLPPTLTEKLARWLHWPLAIAAMLAALYLVFAIYTTGQAAWAAGLLGIGCIVGAVYLWLEQLGGSED